MPAPIAPLVNPPVVEKALEKPPMNWVPPEALPPRKPWTLPFTFTAARQAWRWPEGGVVAAPSIRTSPVSEPTFVVPS